MSYIWFNECPPMWGAAKYLTLIDKPSKPSSFNDCCPKCNDRGEWRSLAIVCRNGHGVFAG